MTRSLVGSYWNAPELTLDLVSSNSIDPPNRLIWPMESVVTVGLGDCGRDLLFAQEACNGAVKWAVAFK